LPDAETGEHYAGKIVAKTSLQKKKAKEKLRMEIRVHKSLHHRNIVGFVSYFEVNDFFVIVLELCANKSMMELLRSRKRLTEPEARYYLSQMVSALKYMHSQRIIHRDLKLGNIFLNASLEVKIGDFGLATQLTFDDERKKTICGTPNYIAPEVLQGGEVGHSYQVDIWSLGVVLYTWIIGKPPFETSDVKTTYKRIRDSIYYFPDRIRISDEAKDLIKRMLQKNPDARPTLDEINQHSFFTNHITPTSLPSTAMVMEPKLPDLTKRIGSAPALTRHYSQPENDSENVGPNNGFPVAPFMGGVPSTAAMHVPAPLANVKSPARGARPSAPTSAKRGVRASPMSARDSTSVVGANQGATKQPRNQENIVDSIHQTLVNILEAQSKGEHVAGSYMFPPTEPAVWIQRWGDYSAKYGLAYQYNTGSFGAYFNDSTIMVMDPEGSRVEYVERQKGREVKDFFNVEQHPIELKKKVNLLQYFTNYLPSKSPAVGVVVDPKSAALRVSGQPLVYVRKWLKTRHAVFFRLTDNTLQVNFTDNTGIILSAKGAVVTFIDKKNQMLTLWLTDVWRNEHGPSISSRLHYIRDMLASLISKRGQPEPQQQLQ
jgi:polo-like kinase 1